VTRILVAGGPRVGKTTLAKRLALEEAAREARGRGEIAVGRDAEKIAAALLHHSDDLIEGREWSEQSDAVVELMNADGPWIIEGVTVVRALRKWLLANPGKPADVVYWSLASKVPLKHGQVQMASGCATIWLQVSEELAHREVEVRFF